MPLRLNDLRPPAGAKRPRKRIGRGNASGKGTYAGKGLKGQKARSGNDLHLAFEGGAMPLVRRMPHKRGFKSRSRVDYTPINLSDLARRFAAGADVNADTLVTAGLLRRTDEPFKVLGGGQLDHALTVAAPKISAAARSKIEAAGGSVEVMDAESADVGRSG